MIDNVGTHHCDRSPIIQIRLIQHPARTEIGIINGRHRRSDAAHGCVADGLLGVLDVAGLVANHGTDVCAMTAGIGNRLIILHGQVFPLLALEEVVDVGDGRRNLENDENVGSQIEDFLGHVIVDPGDEGDHGNYGRYSDDYTEQGQHGTQFVDPQRLQRDSDSFGDVHECGTPVSGLGAKSWDLDSACSEHWPSPCSLQVYQPSD